MRVRRRPLVARSIGRPRGSRMLHGAAKRVDAHVVSVVRLAFCEQIRRVREDAGVSVDELALAIGRKASTVHCYERGVINLSVDTLAAIAMALRVPVDHLVPEV